jgi:fibronectin-binding autotransporter adhesin
VKKSLPLTAVLCAVVLLPVARGRAQDLYVGSNAANVTTNFTSGTNLFANVYVGYSSNVSTFSATNNLLNVSGSGTLLTNTNDFFVGVNGSGSRLVISNGGQVATGGFVYLGYSSLASNSSALVTGTNSRWTASGFDVGYDGGASSLVISNGGQALGTFGVRIGGYSSSNSVLVSGAGSLFSGPINLGGDVGLGHFNSLVVSNRGTVTSTNPSVGAVIGRDSSNNTVLVTGSGSAWTESGTINLGYYGKGTGNRLVISNGGTLTSAGGTIGVGNTSVDPALSGNASNSVLVTGTNSSWTSTGLLVVGRNSDGNSLTIADGGSVICGTNLTINQLYKNTNGSYAGSLVLVQSGRLVVTNGQINFGAGLGTLQVEGGTVEVKQLLATTPITPSGQIFPAERRGSFVLLNGGTIISGATTISNGNSSDDSTFYVGGTNGSGASFVAKGGTHTFWADVTVGRSGSNNSLVITNGAEVFLKSRPYPNGSPIGGTNFVIGVATGAANNSVSISSGRFVMTNGTFEIGRAGSGALNVTGGSVEVKTLTATNGTNSVIAFNGGTIISEGTTVNNLTNFVIGDTGSGASFIANGGSHSFASNMVVGNSGSGNSLVISNGGSVTNSVGHIGSAVNSSNNSALVTGTNSLWTNSGILYVGFDGRSNSLVVSGGGTVASQQGYIGSSSVSSNNSALVTGSGSLWTTPSDFRVGREGDSNSLTISNGGRVASANGYIGTFGNSSGNSALVTGTNSVWTNSSDLRVGREGSGNSLTISNGGTAVSVNGSVGHFGNSSNNSALVTGANSVWTNREYFYVGAWGSSNSLVVSNGGTVAALISQIGTFGSSLNNSVLVTGTNSLFNNALYLFIGGSGNSGNSMVISNGGLVTVGIDSRIGGDVAADNNSVLVTGAGSRWSNAFSLFVGTAGVSNSLTVANGGNASAGSGLTIAASNGSVATLNMGRFGTNDTAGIITAPSIAFGAGTGVINFNQSDATTITAAISGNGAVKQLGAGTTTLSASNTYTGDTTISAGTLRVSSENGAGGSRIIQTTLSSLVEFLGGGRMTNQMTVFQYSFANSFEAAGQVTLADAASSIAVSSGATVTGSGSFIGTGGLTKKGAGTLSLTAGNSFSGPLNVQAGTLALAATSGSAAASVSSIGVTNGATLLVSQSHQVNNSAAVTLSGGTITRGSGVSETFGNLNVSASSVINFGATSYGSAGNLTFGTYTPSSLLTINNFDFGSTLVFGSDLRSSITNSSLFSFTNGGIGSSSWNPTTSTFTITAIPEPSTYLAALGLLALMLWPLRRKHTKAQVLNKR